MVQISFSFHMMASENLTHHLEPYYAFKWMSDWCLMPIQQFFNYIMTEHVNFQWDDDEVRFVLD